MVLLSFPWASHNLSIVGLRAMGSAHCLGVMDRQAQNALRASRSTDNHSLLSGGRPCLGDAGLLPVCM
jgi:hypothetical protein